MSLAINSFKKGGNVVPMPVGAHLARLVQVVDKGVQVREAYQGVPKDPIQMLVLTYEMPFERMLVDGVDKPRWFSHTVNASTHQKATLTKVLGVLDPNRQAESVGSLINTPCMVNVVNKTDAQGNILDGVKIGSISAVPAGFEVPPLANAPRLFDFTAPDPEAYKQLPQWLCDDICKAQNFPGSPVEAMVASLSQVPAQGSAPVPAQAPVNPVAAAPAAVPVPAPVAVAQAPVDAPPVTGAGDATPMNVANQNMPAPVPVAQTPATEVVPWEAQQAPATPAPVAVDPTPVAGGVPPTPAY